VAAEQDQSPTDAENTPGADTTAAVPLAAAVLLHAAVLAICAFAAYTANMVGAIDPSETHPQGNPALAGLVALAVLVPIIGIRAQLARRMFGRLVLALGLAYTFSLAFEPLMSPPLPEHAAVSYQMSWAVAALLVLIVAWCLCLPRRWRPALGFTGLEAPAAVSALGLCALALALLLSVGRRYDAEATYTIMLVIKAAQYGLICVIAATVSGARRVGAWLHLYVLIALAAALALSLLGGGESAQAEHSLWGTLV